MTQILWPFVFIMSSSNDSARESIIRSLRRDVAYFENDAYDGVTIGAVVDADHWKGKIKGPSGTPYEGGSFQIDIKIPPEYPFQPPTMSFDTKIWHPNISPETGSIGLGMLIDDWSPALNIQVVLISLQAFLSDPDLSEPGCEAANPEAAEEYKRSVEEFNRAAKKWTELYAKGKFPWPPVRR